MRHFYFSLYLVNLAFYKLNFINLINLEFREEKNNTSNKEALAVFGNSFSSLKNLKARFLYERTK